MFALYLNICGLSVLGVVLAFWTDMRSDLLRTGTVLAQPYGVL